MRRAEKVLLWGVFLMLVMSHSHAYALPVTVTTSTLNSGVSVYEWYGQDRLGGASQSSAPGWMPPHGYLEFAFDNSVKQVTATIEEVSMLWSVGFPTDFFITDRAGNILSTARLDALTNVGDTAAITLYSGTESISSLFVQHLFDMEDSVMVTSITYETAPEPGTLALFAVGGVAALFMRGRFKTSTR